MQSGEKNWKRILTPQRIGVALLVVITVGFFLRDRARIVSLEKENRILVERIDAYGRDYRDMSARLTALMNDDDMLRTLAGADVIDKDIRLLGTGGTYLPGVDEKSVSSPLALTTIESIDNLEERTDLALSLQEKSFEELQNILEARKKRIDSYPSCKPVEGGWLSCKYGYRVDPFTGKRTFHRGVDLSNRMNTPIHAAADGRVIYAGWAGRYGKVVKLDHGGGFRTLYAHLNKISVRRGERVKKGQVIALMGTTGRSTGPHLHYEIHKNGKTVNPVTYYLPDNRVFAKR